MSVDIYFESGDAVLWKNIVSVDKSLKKGPDILLIKVNISNCDAYEDIEGNEDGNFEGFLFEEVLRSPGD